VFGNDPRQGYVEGSRYIHPSLGFEMGLPEGWKHQDTRQALVAVEPNQRARLQLSLASTEVQSPVDFVQSLQSSGRIAGASGGGESVGGFPAWLGRLRVPDGQGGVSVLTAAFIRKAPKQMFQVLGQSATPGDANDERILSSARSFGPISERARLTPTPARVKVVRVGSAGAFAATVQRLGPGTPAEELAILNNRQLDETVRSGELLKVVTPAALR
jgi:predicted Zn-dependent protease